MSRNIPTQSREIKAKPVRSFKIRADLLDDFSVQRMSPAAFKAAMVAAMRGDTNEFTAFLTAERRLPANEWAPIRQAVFERDQFTCGYCGVHGGRLECDHIVPVAHGGTDHLDNLITACFPCNRAKRDKLVTVEQWKAERSAAHV